MGLAGSGAEPLALENFAFFGKNNLSLGLFFKKLMLLKVGLMLRIIPWKKCTTIRFGLIVHEHLSWKPHMDYLSQKLCTSYEVKLNKVLFFQILKY